jgi:GrpB-like predicted nucleotidyltransferase (UPF0157 family)
MGELLAKPTVRIVPYDPSWPVRFEEEAGRLRGALGDLAQRIEHIGSTAIPGMGAKPIIDIAIALKSLDPEEPYRGLLEQIGYEYGVQPDEFFNQRRYFKLNREGRRVANLHVTLARSLQERRHVAFRDALRREPSTAAAYEQLKRELAERFPADRGTYTEAKTSFIEQVLTRVLA